MEPVKVCEGIYWVGALDFGIRDFHGYWTNSGTTYNAYLVVDEKITLIDTVKDPFVPEMLGRISKLVDPAKIDQIVSNHAEDDHASGLPQVLRAIGHEVPVYCSPAGAKALDGHFHLPINYREVKTGDTLGLGKRSLSFLETRMLHWPDSMFSFCPEEGILFSNDAFGMHLCTFERFDDEVPECRWLPEAFTYVANILAPYTGLITKLIAQVTEMGLADKIKIIAPDHGFIWRSDPLRIVKLYAQWAKQEPSRQATVVFDSMWGATKAMAMHLGEALAREGVPALVRPLKGSHRSSILTDCYASGAVLVGSPTLNNTIYPTVADFMCYLKGLRLQNKVAGAFGSYGWSGESPKILQAMLAEMKYNLPAAEIRQQWVPRPEDFQPLTEMAKAVAAALPRK